jgi:hypothetical protein
MLDVSFILYLIETGVNSDYHIFELIKTVKWLESIMTKNKNKMFDVPFLFYTCRELDKIEIAASNANQLIMMKPD